VAWISLGGAAQTAKAQSPDATQALTQADVQEISANLKTIRDYIADLEAQRKALGPGPDEGLLGVGPDKVPFAAAGLSSGGAVLSNVGHKADDFDKVLESFANNPFAQQNFLSRFAGTTQSETSVAWCGKNAVVGFNDSGGLAGTLLGLYRDPAPDPCPIRVCAPRLTLSFNGFAVSRDAGETFTQRPPLLAPLPEGFRSRNLFGDPVVRCSDSNTFYYASMVLDSPSRFISYVVPGISVSISTDGGQNFSRTVIAARKDMGFRSASHFVEKPWMDVSPGPRGDTLHVTYTVHDFSRNSVCGPTQRTGIEYVRSTDSGATWSAPMVIAEVCGFARSVQGSQVKVGVGSDVFVAWEDFVAGFVPPGERSIQIRRSSDGGASFGPPVTVTGVTPAGKAFTLQGGFRVAFDLQGLAVDRSGGPNGGTVYVTWHDGRNLQIRDPFLWERQFPPLFFGTYGFGDVLLSRSTDGGATWSAPLRVNDDPIDLAVDQFMPATTVDGEGNVFIVFYDRRRDPRNFLIDTFLAKSKDGGRTFSNHRLTKRSFPSVVGQDVLVPSNYMGNYISVAADSTGSFEGVIAAWGDNSLGNPNVAFVKKE
jgi:hypothetical protein